VAPLAPKAAEGEIDHSGPAMSCCRLVLAMAAPVGVIAWQAWNVCVCWHPSRAWQPGIAAQPDAAARRGLLGQSDGVCQCKEFSICAELNTVCVADPRCPDVNAIALCGRCADRT
jgi:hypothetical protein